MPGIPGCKVREQVPGCGKIWWDFGCWRREGAGFRSWTLCGKKKGMLLGWSKSHLLFKGVAPVCGGWLQWLTVENLIVLGVQTDLRCLCAFEGIYFSNSRSIENPAKGAALLTCALQSVPSSPSFPPRSGCDMNRLIGNVPLDCPQLQEPSLIPQHPLGSVCMAQQ